MPSGPSLKVGLVFDDSLDSSDGVAQYVKTLGGWLTAQGHEVVYLVGETKSENWRGGKIYSLSRNVSVSFNGNKLSMPLLPKQRLIKDVLNKESFDVLHVMLPCSPLMAGRLVAAAPRPTAVVGTFHIFPSGWLSKIGSRLLRIALFPTLKKFQSVVSVSQPAQQFAHQAYGISSQILPNPIDLKAMRTTQAADSDNRIIFLGRLVPRKGCRQLIEAFDLLSREMPGVRLEIAGTGPQIQSLKKLAAAKGIKDKVSFLGFIDEADKPRLLASASIACFPSLYGESFGIVLLEAMAAGAGAVLGGDNPGYRSVLGDKPVLLVNPNDTDAFAERLKRLLMDRHLRREINSWQTAAVRQYDIGSVGPKVVRLYLAAIAKADRTIHNKRHG